MPPRRTTRQSATSTVEAEPAPAPARRTRASLTQVAAAPADDSADELEMDEPVKPVRKTRAPAKKSEPVVKETKAPAGRRTAVVRGSVKVTSTEETTAKPKAVGRRKVKEVEPIVQSEEDEEEEVEADVEGSAAAHAGEVPEHAEQESAIVQETIPAQKAAGDGGDDEEEDDEPTIRRAPSSAPRQPESQPRPSSRRTSVPIPVPAQTEDDALDALLSQSQHRSIHHQRTNSQLDVPQTPIPGRMVPHTPAQPTARARFVPGTVQGTAMKGKPGLFPQTPGAMSRTPGPGHGQGQDQGHDVKPVAAPKKRLVIHKLVLVDFKSYAGRQEIGPFHKVRSLGRRYAVLREEY